MTIQIAPPVALGSDELVPGKAFAHPGHVAVDAATLSLIVRDVARLLPAGVESNTPIIHYEPDRDDWYRRIVVPSASQLLEHDQIAIVGFFGLVRHEVDPGVKRQIDQLGEQLMGAVLSTPGILGYSTHLLADERNYANLVMLSDPGLIARWRTTAPHPRAADVSPNYYEYVRIYNGSLDTADLHHGGQVTLGLVKYWDYRTRPVWHAVRALSAL